MCNAITHPAETEQKMMGGSMEKCEEWVEFDEAEMLEYLKS